MRLQPPSDHRADNVVGRKILGFARFDDAPVAQNGHAIRDLRQLFKTMRNIDDSDPARLQRADDLEKLAYFAVGERRGRLVHHDNARVARQDLGDFDQLLLRNPKLRRFDRQRQRNSEFAEDCLGTLARGALVEQQTVGGLVAEHDVVDRVERRDQIELLIDHADAQIFGCARRVDGNGLAIDRNFAGVGALRAGQDLHERRFAGAVFADQCVHFAGLQVERNVFERANTGKRLPDAAHLEERTSRLCYFALAFV